jgi:hypothetical protein
MSAIEMSIEERVAALEQSVAELQQSGVKPGKKSKKAKAEASDAPPKEKKEPSAWNLLVTQTVSEMKQSGWQGWTDLKGVAWPGSKRMELKGAEQYVYDGGEHDGKPPSPALGGMVRASYLKAQSDPAHKAKAEAYHAKLAEKRSNASTGSGAREEPVADAPEAGAKKGGRPKMTDEQKAAAKVKRDAKKASEAAAAATEELEMAAEEEDDGAATPVAASVGGGGSAAASAAVPAPKPAAAPAKAEPKSKFPAGLPKLAGSSMERIKAGVAGLPAAKPKAKPVDISLYRWSLDGTEYFTNDRKDVVDATTGEWIGRFNGVKIDESVPEPADMADAGMRDE